MELQKITYLLEQYAADRISEAELTELKKLIEVDAQSTLFSTAIREGMEKLESSSAFDALRWQQVFHNVITIDKRPAPVRSIFSWKKIAVAASILLVISISGYFFLSGGGREKSPFIVKNGQLQDVKAPDKTKAVITLADGSTVAIDDLTSLSQGNVQLLKNEKGQIIYNSTGLPSGISSIAYNTLSNPRGSKMINIRLSDGSRVWLNAGSSITYPVAFNGKEKKVRMTGEGYFEVVKDPTKKFIVEANGSATEVLGTRFNVKAYEDEEAIKVTLLEGSVAVRRETSDVRQGVVIKPGEQVVIRGNSPLTIDHSPDLNEVIAWKNGLFQFNKTDTRTVMQQLEKWYDIEVKYTGAVPNHQFIGQIDRSLSLVKVLNILAQSGLKFTVENKVLTIL